MKLFKPKLSVILYPLFLLLSLFAAGAARGETVECTTWADVKTALTSGKSAKLSADITADSAIDLTGGDVTLDLNGHKVAYGASSYLVKMTGTTFTIDDSGTGGTIDGGSVYHQINGFFQVDAGACCVFKNGTIKGFQAYSGGVFCIAATGSLDFRGGTIQSCDAYYGGAITVDGTFTMSGGTIENCWAQENGGAINGASGSVIGISGGTISDCSAKYGGGLKSGGSITLSGGIVSECTASYSGGGIDSGGALVITGGTIIDCRADGYYGGGVFVSSGTCTVSNGTITGCHALELGGAICHGSKAQLKVSGGLFLDNSCFCHSGNANFGSSTTAVSGGVFNNWSGTDATLTSGSTAVKGNNYTFVGKNLVLDRDEIVSGTLTYDPQSKTYKDINLIDTDVSTVTQAGDTWVVTGTPITYVECSDWTSLKSALENGDSVKMMNDITQDGEAACLECGWSQTLNSNGCTLKRKSGKSLIVLKGAGNELIVKGGGTVDGMTDNLSADGACFNVAAGRLVIKGGTFKGTTYKNGGAIAVQDGASCEMRAGLITTSHAKYGGGVYVYSGGTFTMTGGSIESCAANPNDGGGIYTLGTTTLSDCTISGNGTVSNGGGIYSSGGTVSMARVTVANNAAIYAAGGVGVAEGATLTLDDCTISNNSAGDYGGGGLYVDNSTAEMRSGTIANNTASDSASSWDKSGGGVRVKNENARFTLSGGTISNNKASNGGGVSVTSKSYFLMTGGTISGNEATQDGGGGIAIEEGGEAVVTGGEIINNTAKKYGGAVRADGAFQMSYGVIEGNTAVSGGASIDFRKTASHLISGGVVFGSVSDNGAVTPITGGVYDNDVSKLVNTSAGWKSSACNGKYVIAQNNVSSANKFSTKDNKIYTGVFGFNVSDSIYSDHCVELDPSRFITQGSDGLWYIVAPPSIYVNGAPIDDGSGTGWKLAHGIVTLSSAMTYTITGASQGTDLGFVVSANATVELSSLTLTLGEASVTPFHFTSGASAGKLNLTGENTVYALDGHSAFEIDSGASVTLAGAGSLVGSSVLSGTRCFDVAGTLKMADGWDGLITSYNTTQDGGAVAVADGGTFTWSSGDITDCTGGNGGVLYNAGTATITNLVITGNHATANGGAIYNAGTLDIGCCRFEENSSSGTGGAIYSLPTKSARILSSSFNGNTAKEFGGALAGGGYFVLNATIINGKAEKQSGAGYYHESGSSEFVNVTFRDNVAKGDGGGIYAQAGSLKLVNVLAQGNKGGDYGDLCVIGSSVSCYGVLAAKANIMGGTDSRLNEGDVWNNIFKTGTGSKLIAVGESLQYVEELYNSSYNNAFSGYDGSAYKSDMSGRTFDKCQIGSFWQTYDRPSLTVESLDDTADTTDGFVTLRDILNGIADQNASYTALAVDGVYKIKFLSTLAGKLEMKMRQYEIVNLDGAVVEIDGSTAAGGRLALQGYCKLTTNKTTKVVTTNSFRAFTVWQGNSLKIKNIDFTDNVGQTASAFGTETNDGGAISNRGALEADNCTFTRCSAGPTFASPTGYGGAIANGAKGVTGATATVSRCTFKDCRAAQGGAIYNFTGNSVVLDASTLESNRAGGGAAVLRAQGGAIRNETDATLAYDGCTFTDNTMILDGVDVPSDVNTNVLNSSVVSVAVAKGVMKVALNASAAPTLTTAASSSGEAASRRLNEDEASSDKRQDAASPSIDLSGEETMTDETGATVPAVAITPANVQPYLYYGLGRADSPDGEYQVSEWVQAGADGSLPDSLKAPKTGDRGYYRVEVSLSGK